MSMKCPSMDTVPGVKCGRSCQLLLGRGETEKQKEKKREKNGPEREEGETPGRKRM